MILRDKFKFLHVLVKYIKLLFINFFRTKAGNFGCILRPKFEFSIEISLKPGDFFPVKGEKHQSKMFQAVQFIMEKWNSAK